MEIPGPLLDSLHHVQGFDEQSFLEAHRKPPPVSIRLNPAKVQDEENFLANFGLPLQQALPGSTHEKTTSAGMPGSSSGITSTSRVPWCPSAFYLNERPVFTLDPVLHAGAYYVQEASSMFLHYLLNQLCADEKDLRILDLCAAPGGKTTLISSLPQVKLVVANEIIRTRVSILYENVVKWGNPNIMICQNDPSRFKQLAGYFDIMVVDAPCSGSGLFRKDKDALNEWSTANVQHCAERQKRILADALPALKEGGLLVYSTCSYSKEEDEDIMDWLMSNADLESVHLPMPDEWGIIQSMSATGAIGYRFFPGKLEGEGFFICAFRLKNGREGIFYGDEKPGFLAKNEGLLLKEWIDPAKSLEYLKVNNDIYILPENILQDYMVLKQYINIRKAGVHAGSLAHGRFIPEHELVMSSLLNQVSPRVQVNHEQALQYLRKQAFSAGNGEKGWFVVDYNGFPLGLIKHLGNRINNYYPAAWRILMS